MSSTLQDVAEKAGVSIVTASRVFNGKETVKPAFRKKVFDAAKALNYTPNLLARGLAKNNLKIVSMHTGELENPYFGSLASNLTKEFSKSGYDLIICDSLGKTAELNRSLATSGSVLVSIGNIEVLEKIAESHPVVGICCLLNGNVKIPNIDLDFSEAYTGLYERAVYSDKDKIAFLSSGPDEFPHFSECKFSHVHSAMMKKGRDPSGSRVFEDIDSLISFINVSPGSINCVFCENDILACKLYGRLSRKGLRIPEDFIVVGCDGTMILEGMWSVMIDTRKIAVKAVELFNEHVNDRSCNGTHVIKPESVYR